MLPIPCCHRADGLKIRVPANGIYNLTADVVRRAGFSDLSKVRIYGYGGHLQNEKNIVGLFEGV